MASNQKERRTVLFIRCSVDQAERIRASAKAADRTISAHVLSIVMKHLSIREQFERDYEQMLRDKDRVIVSRRKRPA